MQAEATKRARSESATSVAATLRQARTTSQEEVAARTGVDRGNLSRYENGRALPSRRDLARLCRHYGLDYGALAAMVAREWLAKKGGEA